MSQIRPVDNPVEKDLVEEKNQRFRPAPEAARILGVHQTTLVRWAKQGRIPAYAVTGDGRTTWLFDVDEIAAHLRNNCRDAVRSHQHLIVKPKLTPEKITAIVQKIRTKSAQ